MLYAQNALYKILVLLLIFFNCYNSGFVYKVFVGIIFLGFIYEVSVNETDLSAKLDISGKYLLRIAADSIHLLPIDDINGQGPIFIWPYK